MPSIALTEDDVSTLVELSARSLQKLDGIIGADNVDAIASLIGKINCQLNGVQDASTRFLDLKALVAQKIEEWIADEYKTTPNRAIEETLSDGCITADIAGSSPAGIAESLYYGLDLPGVWRIYEVEMRMNAPALRSMNLVDLVQGLVWSIR